MRIRGEIPPSEGHTTSLQSLHLSDLADNSRLSDLADNSPGRRGKVVYSFISSIL